MRIAILYTFFALISISVNLSTQFAVTRLTSFDCIIAFSIGAGTLSGLAVKYVLDRNYIFNNRKPRVRSEAGSFILYAGTGLFTTLIFWGTELGFHMLFEADAYRYIGGAIGLMFGYLFKYHLDKKLVFRGQNGE